MNTISFISPQSRGTAKAKANKVAMTEFDLCMWLGDAMPGDTLEYYLSVVRTFGTTRGVGLRSAGLV